MEHKNNFLMHSLLPYWPTLTSGACRCMLGSEIDVEANREWCGGEQGVVAEEFGEAVTTKEMDVLESDGGYGVQAPRIDARAKVVEIDILFLVLALVDAAAEVMAKLGLSTYGER